MEDLLAAQADKQSDMHDVIDEAIADRAVVGATSVHIYRQHRGCEKAPAACSRLGHKERT